MYSKSWEMNNVHLVAWTHIFIYKRKHLFDALSQVVSLIYSVVWKKKHLHQMERSLEYTVYKVKVC